MLIQIPSRQLLAARHTAGQHDVRYYLNGVHVIAERDRTRLVATNGKLLSLQRFAVSNDYEGEFTIPNDTINFAAKCKCEMWHVETDGDRAFALHAAGQVFPFVPVEGVFPDWQRIIPKTVSGFAGDFDPALVQLFVKAGKELGAKGSPVIRQAGLDPAIVQFLAVPDFCGVLMPMRMFNEKCPDPGLPTWAMD